MSNPLRHIDEAKQQIERRQRQRDAYQLEHRGSMAAEVIADELTLMRAEMIVIRDILGTILARQPPTKA